MRKFVVAALWALLVVVAYAGWRSVRTSGDEVCSVCRRPLHPNSRVEGIVAGKRVVFCCPACAMSEEMQASGVRLTQMTDYLTGAKLAPQRAYLVRGGDINPCTAHRHMPVNQQKRAAKLQFDRCSPSLLAFATRAEAAAFQAQHGGKLVEPATSPR